MSDSRKIYFKGLNIIDNGIVINTREDCDKLSRKSSKQCKRIFDIVSGGGPKTAIYNEILKSIREIKTIDDCDKLSPKAAGYCRYKFDEVFCDMSKTIDFFKLSLKRHVFTEENCIHIHISKKD